MNVGQTLEPHLGWACRGLGHKIGEALEVYYQSHKVKPLKDLLKTIYGDDKAVAALKDDHLIEVSEDLRAGVPVATPVFDGARENEIKDLLAHAKDPGLAGSSTTATKEDAPLIEIPQSVSVVTQDQLTSRNVQTVSEAIRYTGSVDVDTYGTETRYDWINIRGFDQSTYGLYRDNSRWQSGNVSGQIDPYLIQEVDIVKGPSSVLYGQNQPGGLVNLVTKRPPSGEKANAVVLLSAACSSLTGPAPPAGSNAVSTWDTLAPSVRPSRLNAVKINGSKPPMKRPMMTFGSVSENWNT